MELALDLPAPAVTTEEVAALLAVLEAGRGWMTAKEVAACLKLAEGSTSERRVRAIASAAAPSVVSWPGSPGYRLWQHCTVAEIDRCIAALESQAADMIRRARVYRVAYHRRYRPARGQGTASGELGV